MLRRTLYTLLLICAGFLFTSASIAASPNPEEIVAKSVKAIQRDWSEAPKYSYLERDAETKHSSSHLSKTYRVLMIDGSPYNLVVGLNDRPLSAQEREAEQQKLQKEIEKRRKESERERGRRIAKYNREQYRNHQMLQEMVDAFQFHLSGQAQVDGHDCWVLDAEPKPAYEPTDHEGHVLKGMKGRLWIDKATNQWVKVRAEVVKPVTFYGFLAKVAPGTEFDLQQEPVADGLWFPKAFAVHVKATALGFLNENSTEDDTYRDYQPMPQTMALLQSTK